MPSEFDLITKPDAEAVNVALTNLIGATPTEQQLAIVQANLSAFTDFMALLANLMTIQQTLTEIKMIAAVTFGQMLIEVLTPYMSRLQDDQAQIINSFSSKPNPLLEELVDQALKASHAYLSAIAKAITFRDGGKALRKLAIEPSSYLANLREVYRPGNRREQGELPAFVAEQIKAIQRELGVSLPRAIEVLDGNLRLNQKTEFTRKVIAWLDGNPKTVVSKVRKAVSRHIPNMD